MMTPATRPETTAPKTPQVMKPRKIRNSSAISTKIELPSVPVSRLVQVMDSAKAAGADEIFARLENGARRDMLARELEGDCGLKLCLLEKNFLEITDRKTDKGAAFEFLCGKLGIKKENTAAFGDNSNDLPLLKAAGTFIAMGNAPQELKNAADYAADTNDNDGVAKILNKF